MKRNHVVPGDRNLEYEILESEIRQRAALEMALQRFGDEIAKQEGYEEVSGIDALHLYLLRRYGWTPSVVRGLTNEDLRFALEVEWHRKKAP